MAHLDDELVLDRDRLRIAAERVARLVRGRAVIGAGEAVFAILFQTVVAGVAALAAVDHAADADRVSDGKAADGRADGADMADDFMAGHAGVLCAGPFGTHGVQVGMADAAIGDGNLHVVRSDVAAGDFHRFKRFVGGIGAEGLGQHGSLQ